MRRHPRTDDLRRRLKECDTFAQPWSGTVYRFVTVRYASRTDLLSGAGSRAWGGRWNPPGLFNCVYASLDAHGAIEEAMALLRWLGLPFEKSRPRVFVAVRLDLQCVLDLTSAAVLRRLGVTPNKLRSIDWRASQDSGEEALTQAIGRLAWEARLEAILVRSAHFESMNLVLFPGRRRQGSSWRIEGARDLPRPLDDS
jgi:RES domain-containing protein